MIYLDISNTSYVSHTELASQQLRARSYSRDRRFVVLGEFSEVYGPLALKIIPGDVDKSVRDEINNFMVQVMAVDYTGTHAGVPTYSPADTSMLYQQAKSRISAFVQFFNLHDVKARGYSRIFTLSFITLSPDLLFPNVDVIKSCFESISKTCHVENILVFHSEMLEKRVQFVNDVIESRQIVWWLREIERLHSLPCPTGPPPDHNIALCDDISLYSQTSLSTDPSTRMSRSRSLPNILENESKYMKRNVKEPGEGSLRHLEDLVPYAYRFLKRSMYQLYKSKGSTCSLKSSGQYNKTPSLSLGRFTLQFPSPTFAPEVRKDGTKRGTQDGWPTATEPDEDFDAGQKVGASTFYVEPSCDNDEEILTFIGESTFYTDYEHFSDIDCDIDWSAAEALKSESEEPAHMDKNSLECCTFDILTSPKLECSLSGSDPPFISNFAGRSRPIPVRVHREKRIIIRKHDRPKVELKKGEAVERVRRPRVRLDSFPSGASERADLISCISPKTIELDLIRFRRILKNCYRDCVFSVLSGRPLVIIGEEDHDMSISFKNALSLFVTCPQRICTTVKSKLTLEDLGKYTLIQCKRDAAKMVECFAQTGLCSVINHEKRCGKAPKYRGELITRIWGVEGSKNIINVSESTLYSMVQCGLVSELASELLEKYYALISDKECSLESALGTCPEEQCDNRIFKYQVLLLLNPAVELLSTSHNLNTEFKYDSVASIPIRYTS